MTSFERGLLSNEVINQITNNGKTTLSIAKNKGVKYIYDLLHKIYVFQNLAYEINDKVAINTAINTIDKAIVKDTITNIVNTTKAFNNITYIDKITASMQKIIVNKSTKLEIITIENQLHEIIYNQSTNNDVSMLGDDNNFVPAAG
ncbi:MAG: hypothetical protein ACEY3D_04170 [Rickettsia sp.]|uniref:hypothetical protein n=1 Tax=Rickettsia sp. TaxID=789 RepID=UPI00397839E5